MKRFLTLVLLGALLVSLAACGKEEEAPLYSEIPYPTVTITMADGQVILLNTQMVRRPDYAQAYGCDDHCGASALADVRDIGQGTYDVVFVDVQGEETRLITTGMSLCIPVERQADDLLMETEARDE